MNKESGIVSVKQKSGSNYEPGYIKLRRSGELNKRAKRLWEMMNECRLCPHECGIDRIHGEVGICEASAQLEIASFHPHFGEERPLAGSAGSGTIFFTNCGLRCVFCINWQISQGGDGTVYSLDYLAHMMLRLQKMGCHNINVVTPTHYLPHILFALDKAAGRGLSIPLVYNTSGWERLEILKELEDVVDVYLPDIKYTDRKVAAIYSPDADTYPAITKEGLFEMQRQVGTAKPDKSGLIHRGLIIRHLVMPNNVSGSRDVLKWISENLPKDTYINIMSQYRPMYRAFEFSEISRIVKNKEYDDVITYAKSLGLTNLDIQK
ncbi:MAG: radical SAM protein [Calditrichaceae bacterium]|jgi:putative pyruvate formate lyase activating enzyme